MLRGKGVFAGEGRGDYHKALYNWLALGSSSTGLRLTWKQTSPTGGPSGGNCLRLVDASVFVYAFVKPRRKLKPQGRR